MATKEEVQAKSNATRLKNLLARKADKKRPLSKSDESILKALAAERNWLTEPASPKWTGRKIRHKKTQKEYVICDVFGEMHVEIEKDAQTTIHNAASLRQRYDPVLAEGASS